MAKAWLQTGGLTFFSSLVTKAQMTPHLPLPTLNWVHDFKSRNHLVFGGYS